MYVASLCALVFLSTRVRTVGRLNRPGIMVYGGTIRPGSCEGAPQLDVVSAFQAYGKYLQDGKTAAAEKERQETVRHACPGPGACGGVRASLHPSCLYLCLYSASSSPHSHRSNVLPSRCIIFHLTSVFPSSSPCLRTDIHTRTSFSFPVITTFATATSTAIRR